MGIKIIAVLCFTFVFTKALPQPNFLSDETLQQLEEIGLSLDDSFDYNQFILNLEAVIEQFQEVALNAIETTVDVAQQFTKALAILGAQQNVQEISNIQSSYFKMLEDVRHQAYEKTIDISSCVYPAVQQLHNESQISVNEITVKLENITKIFTNYTASTYIEPAKENLAKSYSIRERIYACPFSFTDFTPFYLCLTISAVLEDIVTLNQFARAFNGTTMKVYNLVIEFSDAATLFRTANVDAFNATAQTVYKDVFVPCAKEHGFNI